MNEVASFTGKDKEVFGNGFERDDLLVFHNEHFRELARQHNEKWLNRIKVALGRDEIKTESEVAREYAELEKTDREARASEDFEKWQANLRRVIEELEFVKSNPEAAEAAGIRPLLLVMGGAMKGPYCAGQINGLHDAGFGSVFKNVVGFSAGSGPAAYFVAGAEQSRNATSLFREECATKDFLNFTRVTKIVDTGVIAKNMRFGPKALDQDAVRESATGLYAGVTNVDTGKVEFIDMKTATRDGDLDMIAACEASSAIPLFEKPFEVNGEEYLDGSIEELPFGELLKQFNPSSILVLPNIPFSQVDEHEYNSVERIGLWAADILGHERFINLGMMLFPTAVMQATYTFSNRLRKTLGIKESTGETFDSLEEYVSQVPGNLETRRQALEAIEDMEQALDVKIGVLWPPHGGLENLKNHSGIVQSAIMAAHLDVFDQTDTPIPDEMRF